MKILDIIFLDLPWNEYTKDNFDLNKASDKLSDIENYDFVDSVEYRGIVFPWSKMSML